MIHHQPEESDRKAQRQPLADICRRKRPLHLLTQILRADKGCDNDHE